MNHLSEWREHHHRLERVDSIGMCDEGDDQEAILESEGGTSRWQNPDEEVLFDWKGE